MPTNPLRNPKVYNNIKLGGLESPGRCELKSGGDRENETQINNYPGTRIKFARTTGENLSALTYEFVLWEDSHFTAWEPFLKMLEKARLATPQPGVLPIVDPRLESTGITQVTVTGVSALRTLAPTKFAYEVKLLEFKKNPKKMGTGVPKSTPEAEKAQSELGQMDASIDASNKVYEGRRGQRT